jgi:hypothetical protein
MMKTVADLNFSSHQRIHASIIDDKKVGNNTVEGGLRDLILILVLERDYETSGLEGK